MAFRTLFSGFLVVTIGFLVPISFLTNGPIASRSTVLVAYAESGDANSHDNSNNTEESAPVGPVTSEDLAPLGPNPFSPDAPQPTTPGPVTVDVTLTENVSIPASTSASISFWDVAVAAVLGPWSVLANAFSKATTDKTVAEHLAEFTNFNPAVSVTVSNNGKVSFSGTMNGKASEVFNDVWDNTIGPTVNDARDAVNAAADKTSQTFSDAVNDAKQAVSDFTSNSLGVGGGASPDAGPNGGNDTGIDAPQVLSQQIVVPSQGEGGGLSCTNPDYPQLCGITSCIPGGATCCSSVGFADRYCPSGSFCTIEGQCESTSGGQNCSASYNQACQSAANSCGMKNNGFNSCTGSCQAVTPPDSSCATPGITLTQTPAFVNPGEVCQIVWATTNTTACALVNVNTGATVSSGLNKTYLTPPISAQTDFRLNCKNGTVVSAEASISCRINPGFEEE